MHTWLCRVVLKTVLHICHTHTVSPRPAVPHPCLDRPLPGGGGGSLEELKKMQMTGAGEGLSILESVDGQKWKNVESSFESFTTILNGQH